MQMFSHNSRFQETVASKIFVRWEELLKQILIFYSMMWWEKKKCYAHAQSNYSEMWEPERLILFVLFREMKDEI